MSWPRRRYSLGNPESSLKLLLWVLWPFSSMPGATPAAHSPSFTPAHPGTRRLIFICCSSFDGIDPWNSLKDVCWVLEDLLGLVWLLHMTFFSCMASWVAGWLAGWLACGCGKPRGWLVGNLRCEQRLNPSLKPARATQPPPRKRHAQGTRGGGFKRSKRWLHLADSTVVLVSPHASNTSHSTQ